MKFLHYSVKEYLMSSRPMSGCLRPFYFGEVEAHHHIRSPTDFFFFFFVFNSFFFSKFFFHQRWFCKTELVPDVSS